MEKVLVTGVLLTLLLPLVVMGQNTDDPCTPQNCKNGASCQDNTCVCDPKCLNGGTCIGAQNRCSCLKGYTGVMCETKVNLCIGNRCEHGASCVDGAQMYTCKCAAGYNGNLCQNRIDNCASNPCQNNADCESLVNAYKCICNNTGYSGTNCEIEINECQSNPCKNGGTCINEIKQWSCSCGKGFTGYDCATVKQNIYQYECPSSNSKNKGVLKARNHYGGSQRIKPDVKFPFGKEYYKFLWINVDGTVSFGKKFHTRPNPGLFRTDDNIVPLVAPLWQDIDTRFPSSIQRELGSSTREFSKKKNMVCWTLCQEGDTANSCEDTTKRATSDVRSMVNTTGDISKYPNFNATFVLLVTWSNVKPVHVTDYYFNDQVYNTFQAVLISNGTKSFVLFNYFAMKWDAEEERKCGAGYWSTNGLENLPVPNCNGASFEAVGQKMYPIDLDVPPSAESEAEAKCIAWHQQQLHGGVKDLVDADLKSRLSACPCSAFQAWRDRRFTWYIFNKRINRGWRGPNRRAAWIDSLSGIDQRMMCFRTRLPWWRFNFLSRVCCYANPDLPQNWRWRESRASLLVENVASDLRTGYLVYSPQRFKFNDYAEQDAEMKDTCCNKADLCHLFYQIRGSAQAKADCRLYERPRTGFGFGDPHIITLDGGEYTFNGEGEFKMIVTERFPEKNGNRFFLQGRASRVFNMKTKALGDATGWTGYAAKDDESPRLQVYLEEGSVKGKFKKKMKIFISKETDTGFNVKDKNTEITDTVYTFIQDTTKAQGDDIATYAYKATFPLLVLKKESTTSFTAVFQGSAFSLTFTEPTGTDAEGVYTLNAVVSASPTYKTKSTDTKKLVSGLLGNYDENKDNDILKWENNAAAQCNLPAKPDTTTEEKIWECGLTWKITEEESLFYYASKKYSDFFTVPPTKPKFLSEFTDAQKQTVIDAGTCKKDDNKCLLDFLVTGDPKFAKNTATVNTDANTEIETLKNTPPKIVVTTRDGTVVSSNRFDITLGMEIYINVQATDTENNIKSLNLVSAAALTKAKAQWTAPTASPWKATFRWKIEKLDAEIKALNVKFIAIDTLAAQNEYNLHIRVCECTHPKVSGSVSCDFSKKLSGSSTTVETFACDCDTGWIGDKCDTNFNGCDHNTCPAKKCEDVSPQEEKSLGVTFKCTACPTGYDFPKDASGTITSYECQDIDECKLNAGKSIAMCDAGTTTGCQNTEGSYKCKCKPGFVAIPNNKQKCQDVDECADKTVSKCEQVCTNKEGSYTCSCLAGYTLSSDGKACTQDSATKTACAKISPACKELCYLENSVGKCGCKSGFQLSKDGISCEDKDECKDKPCGATQTCKNKLKGEGYECKCAPGFKVVQKSCIACTGLSYGDNCATTCACSNREQCDNTIGCKCLPGWRKSSPTSTTCDANFNECTAGDPCGSGGKCMDTEGSFKCRCPSGAEYTGIPCPQEIVAPGLKVWEIVAIGIGTILFFVVLISLGLGHLMIQKIKALKAQNNPQPMPESLVEESLPDSWRMPTAGSYNRPGLHWRQMTGTISNFDEFDDDFSQISRSNNRPDNVDWDFDNPFY